MLHYSLNLYFPINRIHSIKFCFEEGGRGDETHSNHLAQQTSPAILWEQKGRGKKRLVTTQFKITHLFWLHCVSGVDPSLSPHPLGLQAQNTWHSSEETKQLQGNGRGKGRVSTGRSWEGNENKGSAKRSHVRRVWKSFSKDYHT